MTLLEIMLALVVIAVAMMAVGSAILTTMHSTDVNHEEMIAMNAVRQKIADLEALEDSANFGSIFSSAVNNNFRAADGSVLYWAAVPGAQVKGLQFSVPGLDYYDESAKAYTPAPGTIYFPVDSTSTQLIEQPTFTQPNPSAMGMPMDLNSDSKIDTLNHTGDYTILPYTIVVKWNMSSQPRQLEYHGLLSALRK